MSPDPAEVGSGRRGLLRRAGNGLLDAVAFLTLVPVRSRAAGPRSGLGDALPWFPVVGAAVGALAGGVRAGFEPLLGRGPATALAIAAAVGVTGALHQDGLADSFDGLGVRGDRGRRLAVMRDSTLGTFGVLALLSWFLLVLSALEEVGAGRSVRVLIAAAALGRLAALLHGRLAAPARADGLGAGLDLSRTGLGLATVLGTAVALAAAGPLRGLLAIGVTVAAAGVSAGGARRALGGSTGDTLGAAVAITEAAVCLALVASWT